MAKCLHCGGKIITTWLGSPKFKMWYWACESCAVHSQNYHKTELEALAHSQKKWMPKRTVEEIIEFIHEARDAEEKNAYALVEKDKHCERSAWRIATAKFATRISDFITGVKNEN